MAPMLGTHRPNRGWWTLATHCAPVVMCGLFTARGRRAHLIPGPGRCNWKGCDCTALDVNRAS